MKKRVLALLLTVVLTALMAAPAAAAEAAAAKTVAERIADIEETYGIAVKDGDKQEPGYWGSERSDKADFEANLGQLETALSRVGAVFTKRLARKTGGVYEIYLLFGKECPPEIKSATGRAYEAYYDGEVDSWMTFRGPAGQMLHAQYMVHEFGHCVEFLLAGNPPENYSSKTRQPFRSEQYTGVSATANTAAVQPTKFVSKRSEMNSHEDYAECFRMSVYNGAGAPLQYGPETDIYKKTKVIYDDLVSFAGKNSRATQRVASYLGIKEEAAA